MRVSSELITIALAGACALAACEDKPNASNKPAPAPAPAPETAKPARAAGPAAEAETIFKTRCSICHGLTGTGDGPGAALKVKPRNYTDKKWQASVKDEEIAKIIVVGGAAVGKDPGMAPNPDLKDKPDVVNELVKRIRAFRK